MLPRQTILIAAGLLPAVCLTAALAQKTNSPQSTSVKAPGQTMVVLGSAVPVPLAESPRSVMVIPLKGKRLAADTPLDFLREDSAIFLEQRGAGGAQSDLVLRGGSFEQTLVLLNGFRINDSQTAHHNLDLPLPLEAINSIQVLEGAGSTLHGVDALSGVVDFLTVAPSRNSVEARAGTGNFGENEESLLAGAVHGHWSGRLTANRNFSTGFMADRDYRNEEASAESWLGSRLGITDLLFAGSDRAFGANQFYGPYNSWERTKGWFAFIRQELGSHTQAAFGYRRHTDEFILLRNDPAVYENNHIDGSWQAMLRHTIGIRSNSLLLTGLEADGDSIRSFNFSGGVTSYALGIHARNRGAGYVDLDLQPSSQRWNLSTGMRLEIFSGGAQTVWAPQLAGSVHLGNRWKLRSSLGYGFRIPTYTDLYYSDPATVGNPNLLPESAWSFDGGFDWIPGSRVSLSFTSFYSPQQNTIDYVRASPADKWHATNLNGLRFVGVESTLTWIPTRTQSVHIGWTGLHGAQSALHGLQSEYVFNYPVQNIHGSWAVMVGHAFTLSNVVQLAQRYKQSVYPVWNATLSHGTGRFRPYLRGENLSNTGYQEIEGVNMPSRSIVGGFALDFGRE